MFSWLFGKKRAVDSTAVCNITNGPGTFSVDVVGESNYQKALEKVCGGRTRGGQRFKVNAHLVLEDDNPYDKNAVRVVISEKTVGYLDRETARSFRKELAKTGILATVATCPAIIVGGWDRGARDRGHFGVKLDLPVK